MLRSHWVQSLSANGPQSSTTSKWRGDELQAPTLGLAQGWHIYLSHRHMFGCWSNFWPWFPAGDLMLVLLWGFFILCWYFCEWTTGEQKCGSVECAHLIMCKQAVRSVCWIWPVRAASFRKSKNKKSIFLHAVMMITFVLLAFRLGRHGKVFLTIPSQSSTDEQKFIQKGEAPGSDSLFDLDPSDTVFFVGGVPAHITVTLPTFLRSNKPLFHWLFLY